LYQAQEKVVTDANIYQANQNDNKSASYDDVEAALK
jgi:hypothetical protein